MEHFDWILIFRLVAAGLLGGLIGMEREFRAKEAGVRTHFIVALGSALFMIISEFAFEGKQHDAAQQKEGQNGFTGAHGLAIVCGHFLAGFWNLLTEKLKQIIHVETPLSGVMGEPHIIPGP